MTEANPFLTKGYVQDAEAMPDIVVADICHELLAQHRTSFSCLEL